MVGEDVFSDEPIQKVFDKLRLPDHEAARAFLRALADPCPKDATGQFAVRRVFLDEVLKRAQPRTISCSLTISELLYIPKEERFVGFVGGGPMMHGVLPSGNFET